MHYRSQENSLLNPLCIAIEISETATFQGLRRQTWVASDVISLGAAYTDLTSALDVAIKFYTDLCEINEDMKSKAHDRNDVKPIDVAKTAKTVVDLEEVHVACEGLTLLVIDNSKRHFAREQELVEFKWTGVRFRSQRKTCIGKERPEDSLSSTHIRLNRFDVFDYLQPS